MQNGYVELKHGSVFPHLVCLCVQPQFLGDGLQDRERLDTRLTGPRLTGQREIGHETNWATGQREIGHKTNTINILLDKISLHLRSQNMVVGNLLSQKVNNRCFTVKTNHQTSSFLC